MLFEPPFLAGGLTFFVSVGVSLDVGCLYSVAIDRRLTSIETRGISGKRLYGVCSVPSTRRVCVQVVTFFSHGYFAASASSISTPSPGLSLA